MCKNNGVNFYMKNFGVSIIVFVFSMFILSLLENAFPCDDGSTDPTITALSETATTSIVDTTEDISDDCQQVRLYAYEFLSDKEQQVYREICEAIENHETELDVMKYFITTDTMDKIRNYYSVDQVGYFWNKGTWGYKYYKATDFVSKVNFTYCYSESEAAYMQRQIDAVVGEICADITPYMSEYEILLHVYESLIDLIDYDTFGIELYDSVEHTDDEPDDLRSIYGAFVNRKAVCTGYSKATQYILQKYGIECAYISSIESEDHAWNLVNIDDEYYYVDTTWGDSSNTDPEKSYPDRINYSFLCMTTAELACVDSHTPDDTVELPFCNSEKYNYYKNKGLYFYYADYDKFSGLIYDAFSENEETIVFRCDNAQVLNTMKTNLIDDNYLWEYVNNICEQYSLTEPKRATYYTNDDFYLMSITFIYE